jgi:hypothetical protein
MINTKNRMDEKIKSAGQAKDLKIQINFCLGG